MRAILKKELRQFRVSMPGYVFIAFILAVIGLYFSYSNLNLASPRFEVVLSNVRFLFVIFVPLFTMRSLAEERRTRTDQLLRTVPLTDTQIVAGKYAAMIILFALPMLAVCTYPLILRHYGQVNLAAAYLSILGFFLLGCASIAIGEFASSLTENPVIAAVLCFGMLLVSYLMEGISAMVPGTAFGSLIAFFVVGALLSLLVFVLTGKVWAPAAVLAVTAGIPGALYLARRPLLEGSFQKALLILYLNGRLDALSEGILDIPAIVYFLSVIIIFLFLTVQVLSLRRQNTGVPSRNNGSFYSIAMSVLAAACCVLVNRMVLALPSNLSQPDFTTVRLYTLSEPSVSWLHDLDKEAVLYHICEGGKEDDTVVRLLQRYADESPWIQVKTVDPAVYPGFVSGYTDERVEDNSIIAVSGSRSRIVAAKDLYTWGISKATNRTIATGFDGEGLLTSALAYVTGDQSPVLYALSANGERTLEGDFLEAVRRKNIEIRSLNLLSGEVPEDAAAILMAAPSRDYSEEETEKILSYLEGGGSGILLTDFSLEEMPQLTRILADYGLERVPGIILEGDSSRYISYPYCLIPEVGYSELTAKLTSGTYLLFPMAQGLTVTGEKRASIEHIPLLTTSASSYSKTDVQNMTTSEKEEGDIDGPFAIGMLVTEDVNRDQMPDTQLAVFTTGYLLDEDYNKTVSGTNAQLTGEVIGTLCTMEDAYGSIPMKNLQPEMLSLTDRAANFWAGITTFLLPALVLAAGVIIWARRRKRG